MTGGRDGRGEVADLGSLLAALAERSGEAGERVTLGALLDELGSRSYGPLLLVPSLLALVPVIGAIPGVSITMGLLICLLAAQMLVGRRQPWIPSRLRDISFPRRTLKSILEKAQGWARPIDRLVKPRWIWMTRPPGLQLVAGMLVLLSTTFLPTALIPWAVTVPALAATLLALAITAHDGWLAAFGLLAAAASFYLPIRFWPF